MTTSPTARQDALAFLLKEFRRAPGRHSLAMREPAELFASIREVLLIAARKPLDEHGIAPAPAAVADARFFVRQAMLRPFADHYAILALRPDADLPAVKDRYRSMMRLMHPDFASADEARSWPRDAASRVNQAYEVLSTPGRREQYDAQLAADQPASPAAARRLKPARYATAPRTEDPRRSLKWLAAGFGSGAALALAGLWMALSPADRDTLVQRTRSVRKEPIARPAPVSDPAATPTVAAAELAIRPDDAAPQPQMPARLRKPALEASAAPSPLPLAEAPRVESVPPVPPAIAAPEAVPVVAATPAQALLPATAPPAAAQKPPTMADVHQSLAQLVQLLEAGSGDRVVAQLGRDVRDSSTAQAFGHYYDAVVDGHRPVRVSQVNFQGEPADGRLSVHGRVLLQVSDTQLRSLPLRAEFAWRDGKAVMTRFGRGAE